MLYRVSTALLSFMHGSMLQAKLAASLIGQLTFQINLILFHFLYQRATHFISFYFISDLFSQRQSSVLAIISFYFQLSQSQSSVLAIISFYFIFCISEQLILFHFILLAIYFLRVKFHFLYQRATHFISFYFISDLFSQSQSSVLAIISFYFQLILFHFILLAIYFLRVKFHFLYQRATHFILILLSNLLWSFYFDFILLIRDARIIGLITVNVWELPNKSVNVTKTHNHILTIYLYYFYPMWDFVI